MENIQGRVALVTGAGRGIGKATSIELAKQGVHVALLARTQENIDAVAGELAQYGVKTIALAADVTNLQDIEQAVEKAIAALGPIDILVNNAGTSKFGKFLDLTPEEWFNIINVNVMGVYNVTRAVLPQMLERNIGDIVNISSTAGQKGAPVTSAYSASKAAVIAMSESLMLEVRKSDVRVVTLTPSTVATDMAIELNLVGDDTEKVMQPEDLAELIVTSVKLPKRVVLKSASMWSTNP